MIFLGFAIPIVPILVVRVFVACTVCLYSRRKSAQPARAGFDARRRLLCQGRTLAGFRGASMDVRLAPGLGSSHIVGSRMLHFRSGKVA
jgi:hypothetical protein